MTQPSILHKRIVGKRDLVTCLVGRTKALADQVWVVQGGSAAG